jgi:hypothetical protein
MATTATITTITTITTIITAGGIMVTNTAAGCGDQTLLSL